MNRRLLILAATAFALTACGGGGGNAGSGQPGPLPNTGSGGEAGGDTTGPSARITGFSVSTTQAFVGDTVTLQADFSGGSGRIEPMYSDVASGQVVRSEPLDRDQVFRLVVRAPGAQDLERELSVRVDFRNRYLSLPMAYASAGHAAVAAADGTVLLIGGARDGIAAASRIERYNPQGHGLTSVGQLRQPRLNAVATRLTDGRILITGGSLQAQDAAAAELVDERSAVSEAAGRMSVVRSDHAAAPLGGGRVLITGGLALGEGASIGVSASAEIWEPATRSFRRLAATMRLPRAFHTMTMLGDGRILVVGGHSPSGEPVLAEIFDPATERFTPVPSAMGLRARHAALMAPDGSVIVLGGEVWMAGADEAAATASVLRYDPVQNSFRELAPLALARSAVQAAMLPGGSVLVFGGQQTNQAALRDAERYDPSLGSTPIATLATARTMHTVTRLASGRVLIAGGESAAGTGAAGLAIYE